LSGSREHDRILNGGTLKRFLYGWPDMSNFNANAEELTSSGIFLAKKKMIPAPAQRQINALVSQLSGEALIAAKGTSIS
jgi:hypothetical protein